MQSTEHTGSLARESGEQGRVGSRSLMGGDRRAGESRVLPFGGADGIGFRIGDLAIRPIPVVPADLPVAGARKVAALKRASLLLVERNEQVLGSVDERALAAAADAAPISTATQRFAVCLRPGMSLAQARELFTRTGAVALPVIAGGFLLGAVARGDIERAAPDADRR